LIFDFFGLKGTGKEVDEKRLLKYSLSLKIAYQDQQKATTGILATLVCTRLFIKVIIGGLQKL